MEVKGDIIIDFKYERRLWIRGKGRNRNRRCEKYCVVEINKKNMLLEISINIFSIGNGKIENLG